MKIISDVAIDSGNGASAYREVIIEGVALRRVVAHYPDGDRLHVQNGKDGEVLLTLEPPFQDRVPHYPEVAGHIAPLRVVDERVDGETRTLTLSAGHNLIQRFARVVAEIPASARLVVEAGYGGNPFAVRLAVA